MARVYSRAKGKHGSKKPIQKIATWVKFTNEEIEELIVKLAKKGFQSARIGAILRDQYGIPTTRIKGIKVVKVLKNRMLYPPLPEDMMNLFRKAVILDGHLKKNKRDPIAKRGMEITESKIRRLADYYIRSKALPPGWKWDIERAKLIVK